MVRPLGEQCYGLGGVFRVVCVLSACRRKGLGLQGWLCTAVMAMVTQDVLSEGNRTVTATLSPLT